MNMQNENFVAKADVAVNAPAGKVWDAFVNPDTIKQYMAGTTVRSDWKEGSEITWEGEWKGKPYKDKGKIIRMNPPRHLAYTHYSPVAGQPDVPENYHNVVIDLTDSANGTAVSLTQDKNATEAAKAESEKNWNTMLIALKKIVEEG